MSLLKKGMNEEELVKLFTSLPARCIVLLEDIDAADLRNRKLPREKSEDKSTDAEEKKSEEKEKEKEDASGGMSLSALLNAIDGKLPRFSTDLSEVDDLSRSCITGRSCFDNDNQ